MPFLPTTTVPSRMVRRVHPLIVRRPATIRALSSTQSRFVEGYGTGTGDSKGEAAKKVPEDSPSKPSASRSKDARIVESSSTARDTRKGEEGKGPKSPQQTAEEEEREYQAEVQQHNKEFAEGFDRAAELAPEMKVDEKFWKGKHYLQYLLLYIDIKS
jgi:hypothetical protein